MTPAPYRDSGEHLWEELARIDGVRSTETMVELRFVKESYRWGTR